MPKHSCDSSSKQQKCSTEYIEVWFRLLHMFWFISTALHHPHTTYFVKVTLGLLISMCERNTQHANTHRWRHSERKETASSRGIIFNSNNLKQKRVSTKQFPALLCFGGSREREAARFSDCSNTWMFMHTHTEKIQSAEILKCYLGTWNWREVSWDTQFSPLWLEIPYPTVLHFSEAPLIW